jgi:arylsulfatase A-like enzyme
MAIVVALPGGLTAIVVALAVSLLLCAGCGPAEPQRRNLLLVSVDTLRADHLGAYGRQPSPTPGLDRLAASGTLFLEARATTSWTLPSLASLMTSLHASSHGCWDFRSRLDGSFETLADLLYAAGFETAAIASHTFLGEAFGLQQGFAHYDTDLVRPNLKASHQAVTSPELTDRAVAWLRQRGGGAARWFLWVHYFDPHADYELHEGISEAFGTGTLHERYVGEVAFTDRAIGRLLEALEDLGLADETVVVVTADHGEEFGEHGGISHGRHLYREVLHVPLLVRAPGFPPGRAAGTVSLVDVLPTALELLGLPVPEGLQGRSLVPALRGEALAPRPALAELRLYAGQHGESLELDGWKLVRGRGREAPQLFDVRSDPGDERDVAAEHPEVVARLAGLLEAAVREAEAGGPTVRATAPLGAEELRSLRELGYIEGD